MIGQTSPTFDRNAVPVNPQPGEPKLLDRVSRELRVRHYSRRTEESYLHWITKFILFHRKRHPLRLPVVMTRDEVKAVLDNR